MYEIKYLYLFSIYLRCSIKVAQFTLTDPVGKVPNNPCEQCGKNFNRPYALTLHIKRVHEGKGKDFHCIKCSYTAYDQYMLNQHVQLVHEGVKNFACENCGRTFGTKTGLNEHIMTIHEGIKNFQCEFCEYKAAHKSNLKQHILCVHEKLKNFVCTICGKACGKKGDLIKHVKNVHEENKNYQCEKCNYKTGYSSSLQRHIQTVHEKLKNFKCHICGKACSQKSDLIKHIRKVHKDFDSKTILESQKNEGIMSAQVTEDMINFHQKFLGNTIPRTEAPGGSGVSDPGFAITNQNDLDIHKLKSLDQEKVSQLAFAIPHLLPNPLPLPGGSGELKHEVPQTREPRGFSDPQPQSP